MNTALHLINFSNQKAKDKCITTSQYIRPNLPYYTPLTTSEKL